MQESAENSKLAKIRALLAKAEGTTNEHERKVYQEKVAELVALWGIEEAEAYAKAKPEQRETPVQRIILVPGPYATEKWELLDSIAGPLGCTTVAIGTGKGRTVYLFGFPSDLSRVELLFTSLLVQQAGALASWEKENHYRPSGRSLFAARRRFLYSYDRMIRVLMSRAYQRTQEEHASESTALAIIDRRTAVDTYASKAFPDAKEQSNKDHLLNTEAGRAGIRAALKADIGLDRLAPGGRASISG